MYFNKHVNSIGSSRYLLGTYLIFMYISTSFLFPSTQMFCGKNAKPGYITKSALKMVTAGAVAFGLVQTVTGDEKFYRYLIFI